MALNLRNIADELKKKFSISNIKEQAQALPQYTSQSQFSQNVRAFLNQPINPQFVNTRAAQGAVNVANTVRNPLNQFGKGFSEASTYGLYNSPIQGPKNFGEAAGYGIGFGAGMVNPLNPVNKFGLFTKIGSLGARPTSTILSKVAPEATGFVAKKLIPSLASEAAQTAAYGLTKKTLGQQFNPATDFAMGVAMRGLGRFQPDLPMSKQINIKNNFALDQGTRAQIENIEDRLRNPKNYLTPDRIGFHGSEEGRKLAVKEAIKTIKREAADELEIISSKFLPNKQYLTLKTPEAKIKALIDLSAENKLANVNLPGDKIEKPFDIKKIKLDFAGQKNAPQQSLYDTNKYIKQYHQTSPEAARAIEKEGFKLGITGSGKSDILPSGVNTKSTNAELFIRGKGEQMEVYIPKDINIKDFGTRAEAERYFYNHPQGSKYREFVDKTRQIDLETVKKVDILDIQRRNATDKKAALEVIQKQKRILEEGSNELDRYAKLARDEAVKIAKSDKVDALRIGEDTGGTFGTAKTDNLLVLDPKNVRTKNNVAQTVPGRVSNPIQTGTNPYPLQGSHLANGKLASSPVSTLSQSHNVAQGGLGDQKYYHITDSPDFKINKEYRPGIEGTNYGPGLENGPKGLMATNDPQSWLSHKFLQNRKYVAEIDLSKAKEGVDYQVVKMGNANEIFIKNPDAVKVKGTKRIDEVFPKSTPQGGLSELQSKVPGMGFASVPKTNTSGMVPVKDILKNTEIGKTLKTPIKPGQKERKFVTSVHEAPNVVPEVKTKTEGVYTPKANTKLMGEAQALLQEGAKLDFKNVKDADKKVAATIMEALNQQKAGNHQAAANLFNNLAEQGTELGRGVQAFSLLEKMSPEAISLSVAGKIKKYNQTAIRKIPELTGEQSKIIADKVTAIDLLKGKEKNIAVKELEDTINSFIPSTLADKVLSVWKAGLLTSLRTHERNFVGNSIHGVLEVAKDVPGTLADMGMSAITGKRSVSLTFKGLRKFASKETAQQMKDIISKGYDPSETINKFDHKNITWGKNPVEQALKKYTDIVFRTLGASDKPFYNAALARSLYDQAGTAAINAGKRGDSKFIEDLVKNPTEEMMKTAIKDANVAVFKNKNAASSVSGAIKRALASDSFGFFGKEAGKVIGEVTMPFTGVPSSILGQIVNYSPVGLLKGIVNAGRVTLGKMPELQRQAAQEIGRGVMGTGIFAMGAYLMSKGLITGQPKDTTEQRLWDAQNKPRNSIFIGGKWRSLNSIGPEAVVFLAGAKLNEEMNNPEGSISNYGLSLGKDYLDQSFVQGLKAPINALTDPKRYAMSYTGQLASSVIPNIIKDAGKSMDPYMREANSVGDYTKSNIPILRNTMIPSRDVLGNIRPQEPAGIGAFVDLFNSKTPVKNNVIDELTRLHQVGSDATPGKMNKSQTIKGVKMSLTPEQLDTLEATVGPEGMKQLQALFASKGYQSLSDEDKANAVSSLMTNIRKKVRGTIDINQPRASTAVPEAKAEGSSNLGQYILVNQETGSVKNIDLSEPIVLKPETGNETIDKLSLSAYKSDINSRIKDVYALYQDGQLTLDQATSEIEKLSKLSDKLKTKKPKKVTFKFTKIKPTKITLKSKGSAFKAPVIKGFKSKKKKSRRFTIKA